MPAKESFTVSQHDNPKYDVSKPKDDSANSEFVYRVETAKNTLRVHIGQYLTPKTLQKFINESVDVSISKK